LKQVKPGTFAALGEREIEQSAGECIAAAAAAQFRMKEHTVIE
jgi:hypothetical protein